MSGRKECPEFLVRNRQGIHPRAGRIFILLDNRWKLSLCLCGKLSRKHIGENTDILWLA